MFFALYTDYKHALCRPPPPRFHNKWSRFHNKWSVFILWQFLHFLVHYDIFPNLTKQNVLVKSPSLTEYSLDNSTHYNFFLISRSNFLIRLDSCSVFGREPIIDCPILAAVDEAPCCAPAVSCGLRALYRSSITV